MQGPYLRKYGVETKVNFVLYEVDGVDLRVDAADAGSDCSIMKDEGAEATCTNDFVDEGKGYSLTITATEMQAARIVIYVVDSATKVWLDDSIVVETYGNASAMHAIDLDDAVRGGMTALPNANADAAGGLPISDAGGLDLDNNIQNQIIAYNLDHLCLTATAAADMTTEVADNTIISRILANGDTSAFVPSTDGLQPIRDKQTDIETDTAEIGTAGVGLTDLGGMSTTMKGEINAEVDTALNTAIPGSPTADSINERVKAIDDLTQASGGGDLAAILLDTGTTIPGTITTAQNDLDTLTGSDGVTLATTQGNYAPAKAGDSMDMNSISGDSTAADNLEADYDGTGYTKTKGGNCVSVDTTISSVDTADTVFRLTAGSTANDAYNNMVCAIYDVTGSEWEARRITDYVGSTKQVTIDADTSFPLAGSDVVKIFYNTYSPTATAAAGATAQEVWEYDVSGVSTTDQAGLVLRESSRLRG